MIWEIPPCLQYKDKNSDTSVLSTNSIQTARSCSSSYLLTSLFSPWSRVLFEKLTGSQLVKKFSAFYGTRKFNTAFTSARHLYLSSASSIQFIPPSHFLKIHLYNFLPTTSESAKLSFSFRLPQQNSVCTYALPHTFYMSRPSHSSRFCNPINIW